MSLSNIGTDTLTSSVTNIERHGFWVIIQDKEYFIAFNDYPDFKKATIEEILNAKVIAGNQLNWPDLDIDIEISALKNPEKFGLVYKH